MSFIISLLIIITHSLHADSSKGTAWQPLLPGPIMGIIDGYGSNIILTLQAPKGSQHQTYKGPVLISAEIRFLENNECKKGSYSLTGEGRWDPQYGNSVGRLIADRSIVMKSLSDGKVVESRLDTYIDSVVLPGLSPMVKNSSLKAKYFLQGQFVTLCDRTGVAR